MPNAIQLENVSLRIGGRQIFTDLNLSAEPGEILAICGTPADNIAYFIPLFTRVYPQDYTLSGKLFINNVETERLGENEMRYMRMMDIGVVSQDFSTKNLRMSVKKYLLAPFREDLKKTNKQILTDAKHILQLLEIQDINRFLKKRICSLSEKEMRYVLYAAAFSTDPSVAIISVQEEDFQNEGVDALYSLLIKICKIKKITLLLLTDHIGFAQKYGENVYFMKNDKLFKPEGIFHPYLGYLKQAADTLPFLKNDLVGKEYLRATNLILRRGMKKIDFSLRGGDILGLSVTKALPFFCGKKRPYRGELFHAGKSLHKSKTFKKRSICISKDMLFPPVKNVLDVLRIMSHKPLTEDEVKQIMTICGIPYDLSKTSVKKLSAYETLQLGIAAAVAAEVNVIILNKPEQSVSMIGQYNIIKMLHTVCEKTGSAGIVLSENRKLLNTIESV